jgi:hypothetical protein
LKSYGWPLGPKSRLFKQDKGQFALAKAFVNSIEMKKSQIIPLDEILEVSRISIQLGKGLLR